MADRPLRLGILRCGRISPELHPIAGDYPDMLARLFNGRGSDLELVSFDVRHGEMPTHGACDAWLLTGSPHSAFEPEAWIRDVCDFVRDAAERGNRLVGICFGHQLIAHALGGRAERATAGWGVGLRSDAVVAAEPWMRPELDRLELLMSHQDQVTELPIGGHVIAGSDFCPIAAYVVPGVAFGVQGHPEFTAEFLAALLHSRTELIGADRVDDAVSRLNGPGDAATVAGWMITFLGS